MHDRTVNGEALIFKNQGSLYMNAMTWYDQETRSIWSQPWGKAMDGTLEGTQLTLIPASIVPWAAWLAKHPETTVLGNRRAFGDPYPKAESTDKFVIGVALKEWARAYWFPDAARDRVINDTLGDFPIVVFVDPDTSNIETYLRHPVVDGSELDDSVILTFELTESGDVVDDETGSTWDVIRGVAIEGPLQGSLLQKVPYISAFNWAWADFYPNTTFYGYEAAPSVESLLSDTDLSQP